jgi:NAD(P)-dependent dehydrogenase (short-subunit alcohol dehydrogenase family)
VGIAKEKYGRIDLVVNNAGVGHDPLVSLCPYFSVMKQLAAISQQVRY